MTPKRPGGSGGVSKMAGTRWSSSGPPEERGAPAYGVRGGMVKEDYAQTSGRMSPTSDEERMLLTPSSLGSSSASAPRGEIAS